MFSLAEAVLQGIKWSLGEYDNTAMGGINMVHKKANTARRSKEMELGKQEMSLLCIAVYIYAQIWGRTGEAVLACVYLYLTCKIKSLLGGGGGGLAQTALHLYTWRVAKRDHDTEVEWVGMDGKEMA